MAHTIILHWMLSCNFHLKQTKHSKFTDFSWSKKVFIFLIFPDLQVWTSWNVFPRQAQLPIKISNNTRSRCVVQGGRLAGSCSFIKLDKTEFRSVTLGLTWHDARNKSFLKVRPRTSKSSRPYLNAARTWAYTLRSFKYSGSTSTTPSVIRVNFFNLRNV